MNSNLRILFMGTPDFALHILDTIVQSGYNVVGVVSVPDKPAGRGQKMHESAVTKYAKKNAMNLMQPAKLKSKAFLEQLENLEIDIAVVVAFRMLPKEVWRIPKLGTFNLHASLLPQYRGAAPINWAIMNGETKSGVTTFLIDEKIDTGNILLHTTVDILPEENAGELHDKLMHAGALLVIETIDGLKNQTLKAITQDETKDLKAAPKIFKEDCRIDWSNSLQEIHNFIRGLSPYPAAWTLISTENDTKMLKIYATKFEYQTHVYAPKSVFKEQQKLGVAHSEGIIWLEEVQLEGKRRMKSIDFLNGYSLVETSAVLDEQPM